MADLIVVDEMSMMNIELFDIFLSAIKQGRPSYLSETRISWKRSAQVLF